MRTYFIFITIVVLTACGDSSSEEKNRSSITNQNDERHQNRDDVQVTDHNDSLFRKKVTDTTIKNNRKTLVPEEEPVPPVMIEERTEKNINNVSPESLITNSFVQTGAVFSFCHRVIHPELQGAGCSAAEEIISFDIPVSETLFSLSGDELQQINLRYEMNGGLLFRKLQRISSGVLLGKKTDDGWYINADLWLILDQEPGEPLEQHVFFESIFN